MTLNFLSPFAAFLLFFSSLQSQIITTFAGGGSAVIGDGGFAINAQLEVPQGLAMDKNGNIYFADANANRVRKIDPQGFITTVAGIGQFGYTGDGGLATLARLGNLNSIAVDQLGNIYIADYYFGIIRKVSTNGIISTVVGGGGNGYSADGNPAAGCMTNFIYCVALNSSDELYFAETMSRVIRKIDQNGNLLTVAGTLNSAGYSGDGGAATSAELGTVKNIIFDKQNNLYLSDELFARIRKISNGIISTVAGNGTQGFSGQNVTATVAHLNGPSGMSVDSLGNLYFADSENHRIRMVNTQGKISTVAGMGFVSWPTFKGDGGLPTQTTLYYPASVLVINSNKILISDSKNARLRMITMDQMVSIAEVVQMESVTMSPNPTTQFLTFDNKGPLEYHCEIMNVDGKKMQSFEVASGVSKISCDFVAGVYFITFQNTSSNFTKKIILE